MNETDIRASVICVALGDAATYYGRFGSAIGPEGVKWLLAAWVVTGRDLLNLSPDHMIDFWPQYLKSFEEEVGRLAG